MTFEKAATMIAKEFVRDMREQGAEDFDDFLWINSWEWNDVKSDVSYMLTKISNDAWTERGDVFDLWMWDDNTHVHCMGEDIYWKTFKKMFLAEVDRLLAEGETEEKKAAMRPSVTVSFRGPRGAHHCLQVIYRPRGHYEVYVDGRSQGCFEEYVGALNYCDSIVKSKDWKEVTRYEWKEVKGWQG